MTLKVGDLHKLVEIQRGIAKWWTGLEEVLTYDKESNSFIVELHDKRTGAIAGWRNPNGCACWSVYLARVTDHKLRNKKA